jgi:hypothetical protein
MHRLSLISPISPMTKIKGYNTANATVRLESSEYLNE